MEAEVPKKGVRCSGPGISEERGAKVEFSPLVVNLGCPSSQQLPSPYTHIPLFLKTAVGKNPLNLLFQSSLSQT